MVIGVTGTTTASPERVVGGLSQAASKTSTHVSRDISIYGLYEISKLLGAPLPLETILESVAKVLSSFMQMRDSVLVILNAEGDAELVATTRGAGRTHGKPLEVVPQAVVDRIVATATPLVVQDMAAEPAMFGPMAPPGTPGYDRVSFIGVPIKTGGVVVGTLSIDRVWDGATSFRFDEDVRFLTMVANLVGQTVRLHRLLSADRQRLIDERRTYEKALETAMADKVAPPKAIEVSGIVGESPAIRRVMDTVAVVAKSNTTVLLRGESGTGKEVFARAIHDLSARKGKPFVKVNCAALSETVLESELFGHEKGAFTGAQQQRFGRFEAAHTGTLLLDEIGEISASFQAKLLRVLQEGEFERVGGTKTIKIDVRLICATNKNLEDAVAKGTFRADLYYRINVVPIFLPPLRERPGDVRRLANSFLDRFNKENRREMQFSDSAMQILEHCSFPGNVRELENCVMRTATLAPGGTIASGDFACSHGDCLSTLLWSSGPPSGPLPIVARPPVTPGSVSARAPVPADTAPDVSADGELVVLGPSSCGHAQDGNCPATGGSRLTEKQRLIDAMEKSGWVQAKAARLLGITPRQIGYALRKYDIELKRF
ncbi:nif-specific transcriptional activator NifA [Acuticoccus sediminis]|uniref:nif-specific transcriptional activator NifA n=1 Tax=Acuticoccus sediminis TaxID=2184697 RepID=UPI001CFE253B|nr:nif-specific transcriptional activator NifA [Acuticoccus sediminis]